MQFDESRTIDSSMFLPDRSPEWIVEEVSRRGFHLATQLTAYNMMKCVENLSFVKAMKAFFSQGFDRQQAALSEVVSEMPHVSPEAAALLKHFPRDAFVPANLKIISYINDVVWIKGLCALTPPWFAALAANLLKLSRAERVLVVGSGTGSLTAFFSRVVGNHGRVHGIDIVNHLVASASDVCTRLGYTNVEFTAGDGIDGWPRDVGDGFDAIWPTLSTSSVPPKWAEQLKAGGRLACFLPFDRDEFENARKRFPWFSKTMTFERYAKDEWWKNLQLKIFEKTETGLNPVLRIVHLFNTPIYNSRFGWLDDRDWQAELGGRQRQVLEALV